MREAYVITIKDNEKSVDAKRCIESGKKWGADIEMWTATTPQDAPRGIAKRKGFAVEGFEEVYSRFDNCLRILFTLFSLGTMSQTKNNLSQSLNMMQ